jgi:RNA polymerase sigma-70 factor (ECF subfamily)
MSGVESVSVKDPARAEHLDFEGFFRAEYRRLGSALYLLTGDRAESEDLAQEAMSRVYERWDRIRAMESPSGYLYRTALNLQRKRVRRAARRREPPIAATPASDPALVAERRAAIRAALASLSTEQREALVLVEWLGMDAAEAGSLLGISAGSVRARVHRARQALRKRFGGSDE